MFFEKNVINKNPIKVDIRFALAYPNIYRTAMSSLGYQILYNLINDREDSYAERIIYPSVRSLETNSPLKDFDIISFSLQYEQDYFNVLELLHSAQIPLKREDRGDNDPLIIAGGPCASSNPLPLSDYVDIFIVGEGEVVLNNFLNLYSELNDSNLSIKSNLDKFANLDGVYVSKLDNEVQMAILDDMVGAYPVYYPIITETDDDELLPVFSNSILLNVSRGCTRGCRFCMSSYLYRPLRETNASELLNIAKTAREKTGLNKVSLIGAAVADYSDIAGLISSFEENGFQISTPSMRIESITHETLVSLKKSGLKTLTIAPESINKLRLAINKDISDEIIFNVIEDAVSLGLNLKLYFLVGLPTEDDEDIKELSRFIKKIDSMKYNIDSNSKTSSKNAKVSIKFSVNPVIPKPHTPLQWETYDIKSIKSKIKYLKKDLKNINIKFDSAKMGLIQYVLSCGDKDVGKLLEDSLYRKVSLKEWKEKVPNYDIGESLPWDKINVSVSKEFLLEEYEKITNKQQTPWCKSDPCYNCGAC